MNLSRVLRSLAILTVAALVSLACATTPTAKPHVLEFAVVTQSGLPALELEYKGFDGTPLHARLDEPVRFAIAKASRTADPDGGYALDVELEPREEQRFRDWTAARIDRQMAVLIDRRVCTLATIMSPLPGKMFLPLRLGDLSPDQVDEIARGLTLR